MIRTILRHELTALRRDGRLRAAAWLAAVLFIGLGAAGWQGYRQDKVEREHFVSRAREQWENQGERHPHRAASFGQYLAKPELPLALFDSGIKPTTGQALWLEAHKRSSFNYAPAEDAGVSSILGLNSAAEVVQLLGALLMVLIGYASVARERETGTLRLVLAQGVSPWHWFAGKALALGVAIAALVIPLAIGVVALCLAADFPAFVGNVAARTALLLLGYGVYLTVWLGGAIAISCWAQSSRGALAALLAMWIGAAVIAPRIASTAASAFAPVPSKTEFDAAYAHDYNQGFDGRPGWAAQLKALEKQALETHGVKTLDELPVGFSGMRMHAMDDWGNDVSDRHQRRLEAIYTRQIRWHLAAALFGPVVPMRALSQGLSGTDWAHYRQFSDEAEHYRRNVVLSLDRKLGEALQGNRWEVSFGRNVWAAVPRFTYKLPGLGWALAEIAAPGAILLGWLVVVGVLAWSGARRLVCV